MLNADFFFVTYHTIGACLKAARGRKKKVKLVCGLKYWRFIRKNYMFAQIC